MVKRQKKKNNEEIKNASKITNIKDGQERSSSENMSLWWKQQ